MRLVPQLLANIAGMAVVFALVLFLPAGTLAWTAGWIFFALFFVFVLALSFWLLRFNRDLLVERLTGVGRRDQKTWDKVILAMAGLGFFAWLALMALDAGRFHWSRVPLWAQALGAVLLIGSFWLFYLTFRYNPYLSPAVRLQSERAHSVVDTGPYHYVRHPMYAGFALFTVSTALLLGSWQAWSRACRWSRWSRCALRSKSASCARSSRVTTCTRGVCDIGWFRTSGDSTASRAVICAGGCTCRRKLHSSPAPTSSVGVPKSDLREGQPLLGHANGQPVMLVRRGEAIYAVGADLHPLQRTARRRLGGG